MMIASKQPPIAKANISKVKFAKSVGLPTTPTSLKLTEYLKTHE